MFLSNIYNIINRFASPGGSKGKLHIFIFHRVLDKPDYLMPGEPDIKRFDSIIQTLSSVYKIISLSEAADGLRSKSLPARAACITFDDGYVDNYRNAFPILKKHNVPATIFVATDYIDRGVMWNDEVIESIRDYAGSITLPGLNIIDRQCQSEQNKFDLIRQILPAIKHLDQSERTNYVTHIKNITGYKTQGMMMNVNEIRELSESNITIGAHTCSHPILANLSTQESQAEISKSKNILEEIIGGEIEYFAYPNGRPNEDYAPKDVSIVKQLGFKAAVSTRKSIVGYDDDLFELPRFTPWDQNLHKFILRGLIESYRAV